MFLFYLFFLFLSQSIITLDAQNEYYLVDDFSTGLSPNWQGRHKNFQDLYQIKTENNNLYLAAQSINSDNLIVKKIEVDIAKYPYLNWKWRVNHLPKNGDESVRKNCDAAASIAIVLNTSRFFPKTIKYSWSTTLEKNHLTESPFAFWPARCDIRIMQSGPKEKGKWQIEKVNALADYKRFYGLKKVDSKIVYAMVIMTDSDNTQTLSAADYDDIYFSSQ